MIVADHHITGSFNRPVIWARSDYYVINGTPTVLFDGRNRTVGDSPPVEPIYREHIAAALADSADVELHVEARLAETRDRILLDVTIALADGASPPPASSRLRAILYEDGLSAVIQGSERPFPHTVRTVATDLSVPPLAPGGMARASVELELDPSWQVPQLRVVAFIQDDADQRVWNAASAAVSDPTPVDVQSWGRIKARY